MKHTNGKTSSALSLALATLVALGGAVGCTDSRSPVATVQPSFSNLMSTPTTLQAVAEVRYNGTGTEQDTSAQQMLFQGANLLFTGSPVGVASMSIGGNPEFPQLIWALAQNIGIDGSSSAVFPSWSTQRYAGTAIAAVNSLLFTSGEAGMSVFDTSNPYLLQEVRRYPPPDWQTLLPNRDFGFAYNAIIPDPTGPYLYGFSQEQYVLSWKMTNGGVDIDPSYSPNPRLTYYSNSQTPVCCVTGAALFGDVIYVAFTSKLVSLHLLGNGVLGQATVFNQIQATAVYATPDYLYIYHQANQAFPTGVNTPSGIYVFDTNGNNVAFLTSGDFYPGGTAPGLQRFAVSSDNTHLYANVDNSAIRVYRLSLP